MYSVGCSKEQVEDIALMACTVLQFLRCHLHDSSQVSELTSGVANLIVSLKVIWHSSARNFLTYFLPYNCNNLIVYPHNAKEGQFAQQQKG